MRMIVRLILSILLYFFLLGLFVILLSALGGAAIGLFELILLNIVTLGCVIFFWRRTDRTRKKDHSQKKTTA
ncbi:hypothetical protein V7R84_12560 [Arachnia propionica]|uniref:hypothetical protein n=1 Tax=Arachnia propionica TaxID=1750 RepID=UPI0030CED1E6